jgi:hypothetical protein
LQMVLIQDMWDKAAGFGLPSFLQHKRANHQNMK